jgi:DNA-binding MarR family transcriptional regulator
MSVPASGDLTELLSYRLSVIAGLLSRRQFADFATVTEIAQMEWRALVIVANYGPLPVKSLARHLAADFGQTSRMVSRMCEAGLIGKQTAEDARSVTLALTPQGRALHRRLWPIAMRCNQQFLDSLSKADQRALMRALDALAETARNTHVD